MENTRSIAISRASICETIYHCALCTCIVLSVCACDFYANAFGSDMVSSSAFSSSSCYFFFSFHYCSIFVLLKHQNSNAPAMNAPHLLFQPMIVARETSPSSTSAIGTFTFRSMKPTNVQLRAHFSRFFIYKYT